MAPIVLAKNFSFVAASGQTLLGDWIFIGDLSEFQNANVHVHSQTLSPSGGVSGLAVDVRSSFDRVESYQVGGSVSVTLPGSYDQTISANLADYVRLALTNNTGGLLIGIVSVWLQMKAE